MEHIDRPWLVLVIVDAGGRSALRIRVWRALKALGAAVLRDGVYLCPNRESLRSALAHQRSEIRAGSGEAFLFEAFLDRDDESTARKLFDRTADHAIVLASAESLRAEIATCTETIARRGIRALHHAYDLLNATDHFPNAARTRTAAALEAVDAAFTRRFSPGEPQATTRIVSRLDPAAFRNRIWATRERPWVDRIASAWFIRRFIDPNATFRWLADVGERPPDAIGFDFDEATFTHVGTAVTFEVLVRTFGPEDDCGLGRLGEMVRSLDLSGFEHSPEATGFEAMLVGARAHCRTDDELLEAIFPPLDYLYTAFLANAADPAEIPAGGISALNALRAKERTS